MPRRDPGLSGSQGDNAKDKFPVATTKPMRCRKPETGEFWLFAN
jgi:hypothetical protein